MPLTVDGAQARCLLRGLLSGQRPHPYTVTSASFWRGWFFSFISHLLWPPFSSPQEQMHPLRDPIHASPPPLHPHTGQRSGETLQGKERCDQGMDVTVWAPECGICWCSGCYGVMYFGKYILRSPAKTFMKVTFWDSAPRPRIATARVPILTVPF